MTPKEHTARFALDDPDEIQFEKQTSKTPPKKSISVRLIEKIKAGRR